MRGAAAILLMGLLALAGCGGSERPSGAAKAGKSAAGAKAGGAKAEGAKAGQPTGTAGPAASGSSPAAVAYRYDPTGKRDPFRSYVLERKRERAADQRGPLEQFDLSQLKLVAVVWNTDNPRALVTDPSGRAYIVARGSKVGKNDGHVIGIGDSMVTVKETYVDYLGDQTTKDIEMRVHRK